MTTGTKQGHKFMQYSQKDVNEGLDFPASLLAPLRVRFDARRRSARKHHVGSMERNSELGRLTGLSADGCLDGASAVCKECYTQLTKRHIPKKALMNDTWQGLIPPQLQMKTEHHPDGLNMVELSMTCKNFIIQCPPYCRGHPWHQ